MTLYPKIKNKKRKPWLGTLELGHTRLKARKKKLSSQLTVKAGIKSSKLSPKQRYNKK